MWESALSVTTFSGILHAREPLPPRLSEVVFSVHRNNAFACRAALMGVKIPFKKIPGHKVESDASPETKEFTQLAMNSAIKRKAEQFARRKIDGRSDN